MSAADMVKEDILGQMRSIHEHFVRRVAFEGQEQILLLPYNPHHKKYQLVEYLSPFYHTILVICKSSIPSDNVCNTIICSIEM